MKTAFSSLPEFLKIELLLTLKEYDAKLNCSKENCFDIYLCLNKNYTHTNLNCLI